MTVLRRVRRSTRGAQHTRGAAADSSIGAIQRARRGLTDAEKSDLVEYLKSLPDR